MAKFRNYSSLRLDLNSQRLIAEVLAAACAIPVRCVAIIRAGSILSCNILRSMGVGRNDINARCRLSEDCTAVNCNDLNGKAVIVHGLFKRDAEAAGEIHQRESGARGAKFIPLELHPTSIAGSLIVLKLFHHARVIGKRPLDHLACQIAAIRRADGKLILLASLDRVGQALNLQLRSVSREYNCRDCSNCHYSSENDGKQLFRFHSTCPFTKNSTGP